MEEIKTLIEAIRYFDDPQVCIDTVKKMRWPNNDPECPHCMGRKHYWLAKQKRFKCAKCRKQFSVKVGSIFEDSPIGLDKWLVAMWLVANCKNGVSSYEIARDLGVCQKTAWFMLQRIRLALQDPQSVQIGGPDHTVEADETYINGKPLNMHRAKRIEYNRMGKKKAIVMGMLDRDTRQVRATVIRQARREELMNNILKHVGPGSTVHTDEHTGYQHMEHVGDFVHETVNHMMRYVDEQVHTNGIENFWALLRRTLKGTYVAVEPFHLSRYVDEQVFRYNNRKGKNDRQRFEKALSGIGGKRLTYAELTGKELETAGRKQDH